MDTPLVIVTLSSAFDGERVEEFDGVSKNKITVDVW